jgi:4-hydroxybenzoate polyprenyltransferase
VPQPDETQPLDALKTQPLDALKTQPISVPPRPPELPEIKPLPPAATASPPAPAPPETKTVAPAATPVATPAAAPVATPVAAPLPDALKTQPMEALKAQQISLPLRAPAPPAIKPPPPPVAPPPTAAPSRLPETPITKPVAPVIAQAPAAAPPRPPETPVTKPVAPVVAQTPAVAPSRSAETPITKPVAPVVAQTPAVAPAPSIPAAAPASAPAPPPPDIEKIRPRSTGLTARVRWVGHKLGSSAFANDFLPGAAAKLHAYADLTRLNKPIGIWLLLWPVLWALWLSSAGRPDPHVFVVFVLGTLLTRSAGCAINDFADRNFDGHVKRTKNRPLVTGAVDPLEAVAICAGLGLIALGLALTLNQLAQLLTLVGGVLVVTYPFVKRFFPLPQVYLGAAFTWSVPMAYAAQTGGVPRQAMVMFMAGLLWTVAYDTMYAMVDREDDKKLGIRSSAILFGDADRFIVGIMQLMTLMALWLIGREMELGLWYGIGIAGAAVFALYQQLLIRQRQPDKCFKAFLNNNYFGMSVFIGIALEYIFR